MKQEVTTGYKTLGCDKIEPQGWTDVLLRNLADGLTGNLDEIWEDVGPDSAWLGGDGESWERGPYYLDGLIPLAALLRDARLQKKVGKWIRSVLDSQLETGYFGPSTNTDLWPRMVMMKALVTYAEIHRDEEGGVSVIHLLQSFSRYMVDVLESQPLQMWSFARAMEACPSLFWLYDETQDPIFLELAETLGKRGLDWNTFFHDFPIKKPIWEYMPWQEYVSAMDEATQDQNQPTLLERARNEEMFNLYHTSHGVNVAMALKYLVYLYRITGDTTYLRTLRAAREQLMAYHGQGNGMFGCDEHLSGPEPSQGTELCTVVELLYSLEQIIKISKDLSWIDWLEHIAYNALLTTISPDGCSHQYNQQVNQISCTVDPRQWYSNHDDSNIFGLEPNFGCCTANMHQGWPKFIQSLWLKDDSGYVCVSYAPVKVRDRDVTITVTGQYPFSDTASIVVDSKRKRKFPITLTIPSWASSVTVTMDGKEISAISENHRIRLEENWSDQTIEMHFTMALRVEETEQGLFVYRGPLLYALPISQEERIIVDRGRFSDKELRPTQRWNYGLFVENSEAWTVGTQEMDVPSYGIFTIPTITCKGALVENWGVNRNSAAKVPMSQAEYSMESMTDLTLIPYGLTMLHIAAFPALRGGEEL